MQYRLSSVSPCFVYLFVTVMVLRTSFLILDISELGKRKSLELQGKERQHPRGALIN